MKGPAILLQVELVFAMLAKFLRWLSAFLALIFTMIRHAKIFSWPKTCLGGIHDTDLVAGDHTGARTRPIPVWRLSKSWRPFYAAGDANLVPWLLPLY
jgi:hypothetical protein